MKAADLSTYLCTNIPPNSMPTTTKKRTRPSNRTGILTVDIASCSSSSADFVSDSSNLPLTSPTCSICRSASLMYAVGEIASKSVAPLSSRGRAFSSALAMYGLAVTSAACPTATPAPSPPPNKRPSAHSNRAMASFLVIELTGHMNVLTCIHIHRNTPNRHSASTTIAGTVRPATRTTLNRATVVS